MIEAQSTHSSKDKGACTGKKPSVTVLKVVKKLCLSERPEARRKVSAKYTDKLPRKVESPITNNPPKPV